jgi:DNA-binding FadR family transcriptional regulator
MTPDDVGRAESAVGDSREVRKTSLADQVAEKVVELIVERQLKPGDAVPSEGDLAAMFGVNRLVVREAIRTLAARERLRSGQGRPAMVTVPSSRIVSQAFQAQLHHHALAWDELIDVRCVIEEAIARRAARRHDDPEAAEHIETAASALARMRDNVDDRDAFNANDMEFHLALARAAGNGLLLLILESLSDQLLAARKASYAGRTLRGKRQEETLTEHAAVLDAVRSGRVERAAALMDEHIAATAADLRAETESRD